MYIHLGRDYVLNDRDIIGIFNLETTTISLCSGRRGRGGHGVSFGAVQRRAAPPRRKDDRVNVVQLPLARTP